MENLDFLLSSVSPSNIEIGFSIAKGNGMFEDAFRQFLNIYYPRGEKWIYDAWESFESDGLTVWKICKNENCKVDFDSEESTLYVEILGHYRYFDIDQDWTMDELNALVKKCLITEFMPFFYAKIFNKLLKQHPTKKTEFMPNQLNLFQ